MRGLACCADTLLSNLLGALWTGDRRSIASLARRDSCGLFCVCGRTDPRRPSNSGELSVAIQKGGTVFAIETVHESDVIMLAFRDIIGLTFAAHGYQKVFKGGKIAGTAAWFDSMGMKPNGRIHAIAAAGTEMGTGILLSLGFLTTFAAMGMVGIMVVAGYTVHRGKFFIVSDGWEYNFVLSVVAVAIAGLGAGQLSLDHAVGLADLFDGYVGVAIAGLGGVLAAAGLLAVAYRPPAKTGE